MSVKTALAKSKTAEPAKATGLARSRQNTAVSALITRDRLQPDRAGAGAQDRYEQEADRIAEHLVDGSAHISDSVTPAPPSVSLLPQHRVGEQTQAAKAFPEPAAADETEQDPQIPDLAPRPEPALRADGDAGRPLPADIRPIYESRLQRNLSGVRLHTGSRAEALCARIRARAFTYGHAIYFGAGQFNPRISGDHLCHGPGPGQQSLSELIPFQVRDHVAISDLTHQPVGEYPLHAITGFDAHLPLFDRDEYENAFVFTLLPDAPSAVQTIGIVVVIRTPDIRQGHHHNGNPRFLQQGLADGVDPLLIGIGNDVGKIIHQPLGLGNGSFGLCRREGGP